MDKEAIKNDLIREVEILINSNVNPVKTTSGFNKLEALGNHIDTLEDFSEKITDKLNKILQTKNIKFENEDEKNELILYLKPTITELIRIYILG